MEEKGFVREEKEDRPVVAICYDFDKTLSPDDMQARGFIQSVGYKVEDFWKESNHLAEQNDMDKNLAYMYLMIREADGQVLFTKEKLEEYGANVNLYPGVEDWFERIHEYGKKCDVIVEHYIISSGLKEMIEGTSVARNGAFKKIYASSFYFEKGRSAKWPAQVVNYTNKTQFLFRIEKGVLDVNDPAVNEFFPPDKIRVPFRNMIYIGDSDTDIPCMKLVNSYGGHSIGVYDSQTMDKAKVYRMMQDNRIRYFTPADYSEGTELDLLVKAIIDRTAANEKLESLHFADMRETEHVVREKNGQDQEKMDLLMAFEGSDSFAQTHTMIRKLAKVSEWSQQEIDQLIEIALGNSQIYSILGDSDVSRFFRRLLVKNQNSNENVKLLQEQLAD